MVGILKFFTLLFSFLCLFSFLNMAHFHFLNNSFSYMDDKNYYEILGVEKDASEKDIKQKYRFELQEIESVNKK